MSKIRVYELAKELGLENKAVLDLCKQLGMDDKASHSNSLSDEEADRIRRSVIRRAVSDRSAGLTREVNKEGQLLTESRVGNVIRRRKKSEEEEEALAAQAAAPRIDIESVMQQNLSRPLPSLAPDPVAERSSRANALREAEALFKPRAQVAEKADDEDTENGEGAAVEDEAESDAESAAGGDDSDTHGFEARSEEQFDRQASFEARAEQGVDEGGGLQEVVGSDAAPIGLPGGVLADTTVSTEAAKQDDASATADSERLAEARRRLDIRAPKVLGRIELPVRTAPPKRSQPGAGRDEGGLNGGAPQPQSESDARGRAKTKLKGRTADGEPESEESAAAKKKVKKKQVLRKDELLDYEGERDSWRARKDKKSRPRDHGGHTEEVGPMRQSKRQLKISGQVSVGEISKLMGVKASEVIPKLMGLGVMAGINQLIDFDTATIIAGEFGFTTTNVGEDSEEMVASMMQPDAPESLVLRPPVVTVMGHVDHGKTSLLDAIRKTSVTASEFGGITQHIGAHTVTVPSGGMVTFLDTPGHEAFTAMRSRGAKVTDIVVLVVAADDGVMPQTIEAINHAQAANVPIIVAVNKIDKEGANPDRVINQLSERGLIPEEWGGQTIVVRVSAHTGEGIDLLLENLHLQAEILELKANPSRAATGTVIESKLDKGRGPVMTVLIQNGTLKKGDIFVAGAEYGRVRALISHDGRRLDEAGPSIPVEVLGASSTPLAGDDFVVCESEATARRIADLRSEHRRARTLSQGEAALQLGVPLTLERFSKMVGSTADMKELPLIVKGDVQGSVEAVSEALLNLGNEEVRVKVIHKAVGAVTENDVQLASASGALVVGFNVRAEPRAQQIASTEGVEILYSRIIYELVDEIQKAIEGKRAPRFQETTLGRAEVRQTFKVPRLGTVAGSYVLDGNIVRGAMVRLLRDNKIVFEGKMASLRRFKDDVREVQAGYECGIGIEGYSDIKDGDIIEAYKVEQVRG